MTLYFASHHWDHALESSVSEFTVTLLEGEEEAYSTTSLEESGTTNVHRVPEKDHVRRLAGFISPRSGWTNSCAQSR